MSTRSARTADKATNDKHSRILKALLQKPANKFCVDCRKKDPRWASFNLGCFMCIRCSGVHRSMGTHISKVKSIDLDSWTAEQVENMIKWGNEKANMYWEARLPENSIPNENTSGIDPWIRSKYEYKQFASKGPIPDPSELGPVDDTLISDLYGKSDSTRSRAHDRSSESSGSFNIIAPPSGSQVRSSAPKRPTSASGGIQGADLFSIGQQRSASAAPRPVAAQEDFFGLNDPTPVSPVQSSSQAQRAGLQAPQPQSTQNSTSQDLFSLVAPAPSSNEAGSSNTQPQASKPGNTDWKNSIMSLYGNQSQTSNRNSIGMNMGIQQQQQQQQQQQFGQFGQLQGMSAFGFGQQPQQPPQQQQQNIWGNNDGFGAMQGAGSSSSSFDSFATGSNSGFGTQTSGGFNQPSNFNNNSVPRGGDLFSMIAGTPTSPTNSQPQNKNSNAFGDLTWN
ncbi:MAG: hypothetical protein J3Q66DRAFT_439594 [Benniella sp.]|nr:MAG: hypothetical protein J3Q66DRAFT_439594 [Benniella sp.]